MTDDLDDPEVSEEAEPRSPLVPGLTFGTQSEYRLIRCLGAGGMGEVWKAVRLSAGGHRQETALKFVTLAGFEAEQQLAREALFISELRHDNIVGFVDSGRANNAFFIAMEFVRGLDLDGLLVLHGLDAARAARGEGERRIPCPIVGFILFMVCRALHHAHNRRFETGEVGLIHRDISPGNVLLEEETGFVKLSDFGVASVGGAADGEGGFIGKIPYAAPEVLYNKPVDARSDIYSLGLVAYELLTGFNPNRALGGGTHPMAQLSHVILSLEHPIVPPHRVLQGASEELGRIVLRMLETDPNRRYDSVDELMSDLRVCLYARGIGPTTDGLRDYLLLQREPQRPMDALLRNGLVFLCESPGATPSVHRPWQPTAEARARLAAGENPAREP